MIEENTCEPAEVRAHVAAAHAAGWAVALHATSEAEVAIALDAIRAAGPPLARGPHRIEHACGRAPRSPVPASNRACVGCARRVAARPALGGRHGRWPADASRTAGRR